MADTQSQNDSTLNSPSTPKFGLDQDKGNRTQGKSTEAQGLSAGSAMGANQSSAAGDESDADADSGTEMGATSDRAQLSRGQQSQAQGQQGGDALDLLRGSVVGVLDSVVREYEPQIKEFTSNIAHQAVDRGVEFAQTAVQRVKSQSWVRLGLAAALGAGIVAVLAYEAEATTAPSTGGARARRSMH